MNTDTRQKTCDAFTSNENKTPSNNSNPSITQGTSTNWTGQMSSSRTPDLVMSPSGSNASSRNNSPVRGYRKQRQSKSPLAAGTSRPLSDYISRDGETVPDHLNFQSRVQISPSQSMMQPKKSPSEPMLDIYMRRSPSLEGNLRKSPSLEPELCVRKSPSPEPLRGQTSSFKGTDPSLLEIQSDTPKNESEEVVDSLNPSTESYTISRTSSPCRPSATPSMEWEEEFSVPTNDQCPHDVLEASQPDSLEIELQQAQQQESQQMDKSESSGENIHKTFIIL